MDRAVRDRTSYGFGPFRLDPWRRELTRDGEPVPLTPTLFDTLLYLVENPGRVVTKEELLDAVWPGRLVEESNLTQTIYSLRRALNVTGDADRIIVTAPGRGYRFTGTPRPDHGPAATAEAAGPERPATPTGLWAWVGGRPMVKAAALGATVLLAA